LPNNTDQILQAGTTIANLPLVFVPTLILMLLFPLLWTQACAQLYPMFRWNIFNFAPGGFNPLSGHADGWPGIAKRFVLLYSPFVIVGFRVFFSKPSWAGREWILSREALGQNLFQSFLVDYHREPKGLRKQVIFKSLNIAIMRWYRPRVEPTSLTEYLSRPELATVTAHPFTCKVSHSGNKPILFLPDRAAHPQIPNGWVNVEADATRYEANLVNMEVNVMRTIGSEANVLPAILRGWFGPDAGRPGTNFHVVFKPSADGFLMRPADERATDS
jgi:hypothetical protein